MAEADSPADSSPITAIRPHQRNTDRVEIHIGDDTILVSLEYVLRGELRVGTHLTPKGRSALESEAAVVRAMDRALLLLAHRARSQKDLLRRLTRLGMPAPAITEALARLTRLGYLGDAAFAREFARARLLAGGQSRYRIRSELLRRGIDRDLADAAIEDTLSDESVDEGAILERVAEKKARSLAKLDPLTRRRRLYGFLARRGFEADEIRRVLDQIARGEEVD